MMNKKTYVWCVLIIVVVLAWGFIVIPVTADYFGNKDEGDQRKQYLEGLEYKMGKLNILEDTIILHLGESIELSYTMDVIYIENGKEIDRETNDYYFITKPADWETDEGKKFIQDRVNEDAVFRFPLRVEKIKNDILVDYDNSEWLYDGEKWNKK